MAIKGKGKTKSRRAVVRPPTPVVVVPPKPFFARKSTRFGLLAILVLFVAGFTVAGIISSNNRKEKAERLTDLEQFKGQVDSRVGQFGEPAIPSGWTLLPQLSAGIAGFEAGTTKAGDMLETLEGAQGLLKDNADAINKLDTSAELKNARFLIVQSLRVYESLLYEMSVAVGMEEGQERTNIIFDVKAQMGVAKDLFDRGYNEVIALSARLGKPIDPNSFQPGQQPPTLPEPAPPIPSVGTDATAPPPPPETTPPPPEETPPAPEETPETTPTPTPESSS